MKTVIEANVKLSRRGGQQLWEDWTSLWNAEYGLAPQVVADQFELFPTSAIKSDAANISNPEQVADWIRQTRAQFASIHYSTTGEPYVDTEAQVVSCAWEAKGVFAGKTDSPGDQAGLAFHIVGTDILGLDNGKIRHYRTFSAMAK